MVTEAGLEKEVSEPRWGGGGGGGGGGGVTLERLGGKVGVPKGGKALSGRAGWGDSSIGGCFLHAGVGGGWFAWELVLLAVVDRLGVEPFGWCRCFWISVVLVLGEEYGRLAVVE